MITRRICETCNNSIYLVQSWEVWEQWDRRRCNTPDVSRRLETSLFSLHSKDDGKEKAELQLLFWRLLPSCDVTAGRPEEELTPISIAEQSLSGEQKTGSQFAAVLTASH